MLTFKLYKGGLHDWNFFLKKRKFYDVRHSYNYYEYLKVINNNDNIYPYLIIKDEPITENLIGQFIVKKKKYFFLTIIYIYCGPTNIENYFKDFTPNLILKNLNVDKGISYIRLKTFLPESLIDKFDIKKNNWNSLQDTEQNLFLDLKKNVTHLKKNLSRNWRHNFYRSKKNILKTRIITHAEHHKIYELYEEMCKIKKINMPFTKPSFEKFFHFFKDDIVSIGAYFNGKLVSVRSIVKFQNKALDIFAATGLSGRNLFASYRLLWEIILICKKNKIETLDLNGLDKINNLGVYNFKIGIGGSIYKQLGILEYCNFKLLLPLFNIIINFIKKIN